MAISSPTHTCGREKKAESSELSPSGKRRSERGLPGMEAWARKEASRSLGCRSNTRGLSPREQCWWHCPLAQIRQGWTAKQVSPWKAFPPFSAHRGLVSPHHGLSSRTALTPLGAGAVSLTNLQAVRGYWLCWSMFLAQSRH